MRSVIAMPSDATPTDLPSPSGDDTPAISETLAMSVRLLSPDCGISETDFVRRAELGSSHTTSMPLVVRFKGAMEGLTNTNATPMFTHGDLFVSATGHDASVGHGAARIGDGIYAIAVAEYFNEAAGLRETKVFVGDLNGTFEDPTTFVTVAVSEGSRANWSSSPFVHGTSLQEFITSRT